MRVAALIARNLLGLMFVVFGLNGFLHFIPEPPPTGLALQYFSLLLQTHYMVPVFALQIVGGLILLSTRYIPLGLVLLGPVIANILLYHILMDPKGIPPGLVAFLLWLVVFYSVRSAFTGIFLPKVPETGSEIVRETVPETV